MEIAALMLFVIFTRAFESNAQNGDKFFNPVLVKQDFGVDRTWELDLIRNGYSLYSAFGYYKVYRQSVNWGQAWKQCDSDGAHLLILNSVAEMEAVKSLISAVTSSAYAFIIGFHDYYVEGTYVTIHGSHLESTGYAKWGSGQPDNWRGAEHCGAMRRDGTLADVHCNSAMYFICERELL